jgi:phosphoglycerate dehydrogenase-like enzyme
MAHSRKLRVYVHNDTDIPAIFLITDELLRCSASRRPNLADRVTFNIGSGAADFETHLPDADVLVGWTFPIDRIRAAPNLLWIHLIGAGLDHLLPLDWLPDGVQLTRASGAHRPKVDEFMMLSLLLLNNRIPEIVANNQKRKFEYKYSRVITGKTALLIGLGATGSAAAESCKKLGLKVLAIRRHPAPHPYVDEVHDPAALERLLPTADFVIVTVPKTSATVGLLGRAAMEAMKPGAALISLARHGVIDENTLANRLASGELAGAVYDIEDPAHIPSDPRLWSTDGLIAIPHSLTNDPERFTHNTVDIFCDNLDRFLSGKPLVNRVDPALEY